MSFKGSLIGLVLMGMMSIMLQSEPRRDIGFGQTIDRIRIEGLTSTTEKQVFRQLELKMQRGDVLSKTKLIDDTRQLMGLGYFKSVFPFTRLEMNGMSLVFDVVEQPLIQDVSFVGGAAFSEKKLRKYVGSKKNKPLNLNTIQDDQYRLDQLYQLHGFSLARVKEIRFNADKLQFVLFEPTLSQIKIVGLNHLPNESVAQFFETKINQPFNTNQIRRDRERLIRTGLFSSVDSPEIDQDMNENTVSVQLNVVERKPNRLELGLENDAEKTVAYIKGIRNNLLIPTDTLSGKLQYNRFDLSAQTPSNLWNHYQISYRQPYFLNRFRFSGEMSVWHDVKVSLSSGQLANSQKVLEDAVRRGQMATVGIPIKRDKLVLKLKLKNESITPQSQLTAVDPYRINSLLSELGYYTTNSRFNPTTGSYISILHEVSAPLFERNIRFSRTIIDAATFISLTTKTVLGLHGNFGVFQSKEDNSQTFETEQFLLGGTYTLRGYNEADYPFSGEKKLLFNTEIRQVMTSKIHVVLFCDFGMVGPYSAPIRWGDFHYGYGAGIRLFTPIGPIRLELARNDRAQTQLHFGLGQLF